MSLVLEMDGFVEAIALLEGWADQLQSDELWQPATLASAEEFRRFAMSISPVVTGAYRGSHIIIQQRMGAVMTIDSGAVNPITGTPVTRYAGPVEARHHVYQRTFDQMAGRAAVAGAEVIMERLR